MALRMMSAFNASDVVFGDVRKNKSGGKTVYLSSSAGGKLLFQMPQLRAFVGLSSFKNDKGEIQSWSLPLSLDNNEVVDAFRALDDRVLEYVEQNSEVLFGKKMSRQVLIDGDKYKPIVKKSKEGFAPVANLKVITNADGSFATEAWNSDRQKVAVSDITKGQTVSVIIDIGSVWVSPLGVGVSIRVQQVMLAPTQKLAPCAFLAPADEPIVPGSEEEDE